VGSVSFVLFKEIHVKYNADRAQLLGRGLSQKRLDKWTERFKLLRNSMGTKSWEQKMVQGRQR
jgi:hypothetical protein